ncbi:MAG: type IX secretion system outer membrane channel protein PorV, partial [Bacteroidetes bacterium]|nr:type IX secretion system outer membrane channel protein PorV [Bacteroidota bacterium]
MSRNRIYMMIIPVTLVIALSSPAWAQISTDSIDGRINAINTAVPFLRIAPDARAGGMGDVGIALSPDANAMHWNAAKLAFVEKDLGLSVTYTPWLRSLQIEDIYLAYLAGFKKIDDFQTVGMSLRYFSLGSITFTDIRGEQIGQFNPNEFAVDAAYARKLSNVFGAGLTLRFIYSNLAAGQQVSGVDIHPGTAVAADISVYYNDDIKISDYDAKLAIAATASNIGSKITYTNSVDKDFIPMNLGVGSALQIAFDDYNEIGFTVDINKMLVPTPDTLDTDGNGVPDYKEHGLIEGMLGSFSDAPGGFREEMHELMYSIAIEYWYDKQFAVRAGYFNEHSTKGNRKFFTVGLG